MSNFIIRKAERRQAKLRMALTGVAGSGKTSGSLLLAKGMGGKIVLIDTERRSADLYSHLADFDVLQLEKPFTPARYMDAIHQCETAGYDIIILDSLSHAWSGDGGVLDMQDNATNASSSKNSYAAWREVTPWHNRLVDTILQSPAHIIVTMRSKTQYEVVDVNGKKKPVKIGLAPVQREGMDYEFTVVLDIDKDSHICSSSKDRTQIFEGNPEKITVDTGVKLMQWLNSGKSFSEIQEEENIQKEEEISRLKDAIKMSLTRDTLKAEYIAARQKFPEMKVEFDLLAQQRSEEILIQTQEVH